MATQATYLPTAQPAASVSVRERVRPVLSAVTAAFRAISSVFTSFTSVDEYFFVGRPRPTATDRPEEAVRWLLASDFRF